MSNEIKESTFDLEEHHQKFEDETPPETISASLKEEARQASEQYKDAYEQNKREVGHAIGKMLVRDLELINHAEIPSSDKTQQLLKLEDFYESICGDDYTLIRSGYLTEYAAMCCFDGYNVYYSTEGEDQIHKVDFWVELDEPLEDGTQFLAIQVKSIRMEMDQDPGRYFFPLETVGDINLMEQNYGNVIPDAEEFRSKANMLLQHATNLTNVKAAYIILPSPGSATSQINVKFGTPQKDLIISIQETLENEIIYKD
jgi:hypothetical protein